MCSYWRSSLLLQACIGNLQRLWTHDVLLPSYARYCNTSIKSNSAEGDEIVTTRGCAGASGCVRSMQPTSGDSTGAEDRQDRGCHWFHPDGDRVAPGLVGQPTVLRE